MESLIQEKAHLLGIFNTEHLTEEQLKREVYYASLNSSARNHLERGQVRRVGITRTHLPEPMVVKRRIDYE
jgi:hypothetical protein|tara:strand:- start:1184 stop:1396 length:213 start_codon:yes stop_codon:yes gene_type:complete